MGSKGAIVIDMSAGQLGPDMEIYGAVVHYLDRDDVYNFDTKEITPAAGKVLRAPTLPASTIAAPAWADHAIYNLITRLADTQNTQTATAIDPNFDVQPPEDADQINMVYEFAGWRFGNAGSVGEPALRVSFINGTVSQQLSDITAGFRISHVAGQATGDVGIGVETGPGREIVWDAAQGLEANFLGDVMVHVEIGRTLDDAAFVPSEDTQFVHAQLDAGHLHRTRQRPCGPA